jgi:hypothetical protein
MSFREVEDPEESVTCGDVQAKFVDAVSDFSAAKAASE